MILLRMKRVGDVEVPAPEYKTAGASGMDLHAAIKTKIVLQPRERCVVPTGLAMAVPVGYEAQIRARSGHARKFGISVTNGVGTIDSDYRGHVEVLLINQGDAPFTIFPLDRIAQLVIAPIVIAKLEFTDELDETARGAGGFGSTKT